MRWALLQKYYASLSGSTWKKKAFLPIKMYAVHSLNAERSLTTCSLLLRFVSSLTGPNCVSRSIPLKEKTDGGY